MDRSVIGMLAVVIVGSTSVACHAVPSAIEDVPRAARESSRARGAARWAGTYRFMECAPGEGLAPCWSYEVVVDASGMGTLKADGVDTAVHVNTKPRVKDDTLRLTFASYIDGGPGPRFFQLGPINKQGFDKGELLATMGRDRSGRMCLAFGALESGLKSKVVCVARGDGDGR